MNALLIPFFLEATLLNVTWPNPAQWTFRTEMNIVQEDLSAGTGPRPLFNLTSPLVCRSHDADSVYCFFTRGHTPGSEVIDDQTKGGTGPFVVNFDRERGLQSVTVKNWVNSVHLESVKRIVQLFSVDTNALDVDKGRYTVEEKRGECRIRVEVEKRGEQTPPTGSRAYSLKVLPISDWKRDSTLDVDKRKDPATCHSLDGYFDYVSRVPMKTESHRAQIRVTAAGEFSSNSTVEGTHTSDDRTKKLHIREFLSVELVDIRDSFPDTVTVDVDMY